MDKIQYTLRGVSIEQFATLFEPSGDDIQLNLDIPVRTNYLDRTIAIGAKIQFLEENKPFLIIEVSCHYIIEESCWIELTDTYSKDAILPKKFVNQLVCIAISTTRGALCAKTENTPFSNFLLPIVEIPEETGEDVIIPFVPRDCD